MQAKTTNREPAPPHAGPPASGQARRVVAESLRRIGRLQERIDGLRRELARRVDAVRTPYERRIGALEGRLERRRADLEAYCRGRRDELLPPGRKSLRTPFGEVGFRLAEPSVRLRPGRDESAVCRLLRRAGLEELIRVTERPDRRAVRAALDAGRVTRRLLARCGLELVPGGERFHCNPRAGACADLREA